MSKTVLYMSMSLDGFIAGPNVSTENGLGDGGERLHEWLFPPRGEVNRQALDDGLATGAVIAGRRTFEPAGGWKGDHHDGVPIYILSRHPAPAWAAHWPLVHYVDDLAHAVREARRAAGERNVLVHGSSIAQRAIEAGLLDEMQIHLVPILLGSGIRLFDHLAPHTLQRLRVLEGQAGITHLRYRLEY